jgi:hypothetical protein
MKSKVLRGATMQLHSMTPVHKPSPLESVIEDDEEEKEDEDEDGESQGEASERSDAALAPGAMDSSAEPESPEPEEKPRHYFDVDVTITPRATSAGRVWEPGEFFLASERIQSLADLEEGEKELGTTHNVSIWDGSAFGPDDPGKYPGEQRLKLTFAVVPGTAKAWLQYYNEPIGQLDLPVWKPATEVNSRPNG